MLFTRWKNITNKAGRNRYYLRNHIREHWRFPTLSLHGKANGLASVQTLARNRQVLTDAGVDYRSEALDGFGHQDIWVSSRSAADVFPKIACFLNEESDPVSVSDRLPPLVGRPPFLGPILSSFPDATGTVVVWIGTSPNLGRPVAIALVEVRVTDDRIEAVEPMMSNLALIEDFEQDESGMVRLEVNAEASCLVLVLYDEHPALLDSTFGDAAIEMEAATRTFEPGDPARFEHAVRSALELSEFRTGLVTPTPVPDSVDVTVAFASCQYPAGLVDQKPSYASWQQMADRIAAGHRPDLLLLLGDQVYVDSTAGLFDPVRLSDRYRIPYERWLSADPVQRVLGRVPTYSMLDDHELENDFEPLASGDHACVMKAGERAFRSYQFEPGRRRDPGKFWGELDDTPLPVFMLNSRTDRGVRDLRAPEASELLSREQMTALKSWLGRLPADRPKIITSGSLPLPRHHAPSGGRTFSLALDGWDGYPASLDEILAFIAARRIPRVVFFSGDEHRPLVATAGLYQGEPSGRRHPLGACVGAVRADSTAPMR
ncbi:MAG: alkaline phosphatase D family protein [Gammaproteobacteria bacterium]|nr:alkaline phosphatase D family protein [Gammaproteobacteria bacterium]